MSSFKYNRPLCVTDLIWIHLFISNPKSVVMFDKAESRCCETDGWEKST